MYHIITSSYSISVSCCPTAWHRRLINKREYSYPTDGRGSVPDRKQIKRCEKREEKREEEKMREYRRGNRGATRQKRRLDGACDTTGDFRRVFPRIAFRSESACESLLLHLRQRPGGFMHLYGPDRDRIRE